MSREEVSCLTEILRDSHRLVFFGGAGVSTESGIPDFRSADGLYSEKYKATFSPEELVSHTFYERYPEEFFSFYREKLINREAKPNGAHIALAKLEEMGRLSAVVTQNIDGLHQMAGSKRVYELHGSILRNYCEACGTFYDVDHILSHQPIPHCERCGGRVKPDVVLYEEPLDGDVIEGAVDAITEADTLIIGGTSLVVQPATSFIRYFRGRHLVVINMTATSADRGAELVIRQPIGAVLSEAVADI